MRNFFLSNGTLIVFAIALLELIMAVVLWRRNKKQPIGLCFCVALLCSGLIYDALIIGLGKWIPSEILPFLSRLRYICSGLMIPLLLPICAYALHWKGLKLRIVWILAFLLMLAGLAEAFADRLAPIELAGILRYKVTEDTPPWAQGINRVLTIGPVIPLIITGVVVAVRKEGPFVLLAGLMMFAFSALGPATGNTDLIFLISMLGELLMVFFLLLHVFRKKAER